MALHIDYRPKTLDDVIGMGDVVQSLRGALKSKSPAHAYLFVGPPGCGKTTLARIMATGLGCDGMGILEINAADITGVDAMRDILSGLALPSLSGGPRAIIFDEAHRLTKNAQDCLLKPVEEPPPHIFFFFCSTEPEKIIKTIRSRCQDYKVRPLLDPEMKELITCVVKKEELMKCDYMTKPVATAILAHAEGIPREALIAIEKATQVGDAALILDLLKEGLLSEPPEVVELFRVLVRREVPDWPQVVKLIEMVNAEPESLRISFLMYLSKCLLNAPGSQMLMYQQMMEFMGQPFSSSTAIAELVYAVSCCVRVRTAYRE